MTGPWLAAALAFAGVWLFLGPRRRVIVTDQRAAGRGPGRYLVGGLLLAVVGVVLVWGRAGVIWAASVAMIAATVWKLAHDQLDRKPAPTALPTGHRGGPCTGRSAVDR